MSELSRSGDVVVTHHVVEERLDEGLRTAVGAAALPLVRSDRVEGVHSSGAIAVDTSH